MCCIPETDHAAGGGRPAGHFHLLHGVEVEVVELAVIEGCEEAGGLPTCVCEFAFQEGDLGGAGTVGGVGGGGGGGLPCSVLGGRAWHDCDGGADGAVGVGAEGEESGV